MVSMIVCCEKCGVIDESIIDPRNHKPLSNYICDTCKDYYIIEKRDKKLNQLLKRNWFDILFKH
jgi:hypothetical protein